jgi:ribonuclease E
MKPMEKVGRKTPRRERPPIQQCLRRGQEIIVQVTKEGIGTKGPTLTTYVSCPGRYLVMMPGMSALGVSRKIEDLDQRRELKRTLQELNPPRNLGFIIRTAGTDVSKKELQGDLNYLVRMWKVIANRIRNHKAPVELYQESDLVIRTIRDVFNDQIDRIIVDNEQVASRIRDFLSIVDPRSAGIVELYTGTMPLYQKFGVEREIEKINSRRVELNNGGSLVIDSTEALVAIDVNSGRYRDQRDAELTAFNMNKEALKEVVRQLRLRDLGGVIVIDFIDMREERHKREIERLLREEMENDRARTKVLRMSQFCMIEMTRQRVRPSLKRSIYMDCPHCHGSALIKTPESVSLDVMRRLAAGATRPDVARLEVRAYPTVATFLLNRKRKALVELEDKTGKRINITADPTLAGDQLVIEPFDARESRLNVLL